MKGVLHAKALEAKSQFDAVAATLSEDERTMRLAELDEMLSKLKRRKLGNMRFIGELCKKSLLKLSIMYNCINSIMCVSEEEKKWKVMREEDIELLCKLLHTVGHTLESNSTKKQKVELESFFQRIAELATDKSLNSRMRFALDEVLSLRSNNWQARREQEGPATLDAIHQKVAQEEQMKRMQSSQPLPQSYQNMKRNSLGGSGDLRMSQDSRNIPYQQQQQQLQQQQQQQQAMGSVNQQRTMGGNSLGSSQGPGNERFVNRNSVGSSGAPMHRQASIGPGINSQSQPPDRYNQQHSSQAQDLRRFASDSQTLHRRGNDSFGSGGSSGFGSGSNLFNLPQQREPGQLAYTDLSHGTYEEHYPPDPPYNPENAHVLAAERALSDLFLTRDTGEALTTYLVVLNPKESIQLAAVTPPAIMELVRYCVKHYVTDATAERRKLIFDFFALFFDRFSQCMDYVEQGITKCEEVENIVDTMIDIKNVSYLIVFLCIAFVLFRFLCHYDFVFQYFT